MNNSTPSTVSCRFMRMSIWMAAILFFTLMNPLFAAERKPSPSLDMRPNAVAFRQMKNGLFITQTYGVTASPAGKKPKTLDEFADAFDVNTFADQMESAGFDYVIFTAWHKSIYCLAPIKAIEKWLPGHTSKRDLVGEIADALQKKNIKLIIYAHPNDAHDLTPEEQARVGFSDRAKDGNKKYNDFTNEYFAELTERYSKKPNVIGYWWDSWWHNGGPIDMPRLCKTVLTRFPGAITLSNKYDPKYINFLSGEGGHMGSIEGMGVQKDNQTWYLGGDWWNNNPNTTIGITPEAMYRFLVLTAGAGAPGGMAWAMSPLSDGKTWGSQNQPMKVLEAFGKLLAPVRPTICNVLLSRNWVIPNGTTWPKAPAFAVTRSPDNKKEYVHVLKAPEGRFIDLPKPVEFFSSARLYASKRPVKMALQSEGLRLTLPDDEKWSPLDTVIELTVKR